MLFNRQVLAILAFVKSFIGHKISAKVEKGNLEDGKFNLANFAKYLFESKKKYAVYQKQHFLQKITCDPSSSPDQLLS